MSRRVVDCCLLVLFAGCSQAVNPPDGGDGRNGIDGGDAWINTDVGSQDSRADAEMEVGCSLPEPVEHRPHAEVCAGEGRIDSEFAAPGPYGCGNPSNCTEHDDCSSGPNGRCLLDPFEDPPAKLCDYDHCRSDADCPDDHLCRCAGSNRSSATACLDAYCTTDADCPETGWCSPTRESCGQTLEAFACRTCRDECVTDKDCGGQGGALDPYCHFDANLGFWRCAEPNPCACE